MDSFNLNKSDCQILENKDTFTFEDKHYRVHIPVNRIRRVTHYEIATLDPETDVFERIGGRGSMELKYIGIARHYPMDTTGRLYVYDGIINTVRKPTQMIGVFDISQFLEDSKKQQTPEKDISPPLIEMAEPTSRFDDLSECSEEELITMLRLAVSVGTAKQIMASGCTRKSVRKAKKLVKMVNPKDKKKNERTPKWRSAEPTSRFIQESPQIDPDIIPDVDDDYPFIPIEPPVVPPQIQIMDLLENTIMQLETKEKHRRRLFECIDFDTPIFAPQLLRIKGHLLEFIANVLRATIERYGDSMPDYLYRGMAHRSVFLMAGATAKRELKRKQVKFRAVHRFKKLHNKFLFRYSFNYIFDERVYPMVEPTSRLTNALYGIGSSIFAGYNFYLAGSGNDDEIGRFIMNWAMQGISVIRSGKFLDYLLWILSFINIFTPLKDIAMDLFYLLEKLIAKLPAVFGSQQVTVDHAAEPTSLSDVFNVASTTFTGIASNAGTIASVLSIFVVCVSSILLGLNIKDIANAEGLATKFVKAGVAISKGKTGLYAIVAMIGDLKPWIEQALASLSLIGLKDSFTESILSCDIDDVNDLKKSEIFTYVDYLIDPRNYLVINQSKEEQLKLSWTHSVLSRVLENNAKKPTLAQPTVQLLTKHISELNKVRAAVYRFVKDDDTRFVPFWLNIYGLAGTRKSTFMSKLAKTLVEALRRLGKYGISGNNNIYSVNFTDKYLTGYKQEDIVLIDDIFQDANPLGDRSSALDIISWVSNIPHHTNQAALDDKGLPFTSKIIISTSNVSPCALNRKEIVCNEALKRRMKMAIEFCIDDSAPLDPMLGEKIRIYRLNPLGQVSERTEVKDARTLCALVLKEYKEWYELQNKLIENGGADDDCVNFMLNQLDPDQKWIKPEPVEEEDTLPWYTKPKAEATSLIEWWGYVSSKLTTTPHLIEKDGVQQFDINYHPELQALNNAYYSYVVTQCSFAGCEPMDLLTYKAEYDRLQEELRSAQEQLNNGTSKIESIVRFIKERPLWQYLVLAIGSLVAFKWYTGSDPIVPEPTAIQYDYGKPVRQPPAKVRIVTPTSGTMDAYRQDFTTTGTDANAMDLVLTSLIGKGGVSRLVVPLANNKSETAVVIRVAGTCILANHHVFVKMQPGQEFSIEIPHYLNATKFVRQKFNPDRLFRIGKADACVYKCDNSMPCAKNLIHHFSNDDINIKSTSAVIATRNPEAMYVSNVIATPVTKPVEYTDTDGKENYKTVGCYEVSNFVTVKGMSGSLLVALDPYNPRKLLGIQTSRHVHTQIGYFQPITQSMLMDAMQGLDVDLSATPAEREFVAEACSVTFDESCPPNLGKQSLIYIGKLDKSSQISFQKKSKLCPSLVHDEATLTKAPAALDKYDERLSDEVYGKDLMFKNMQGYDTADYGCVDTKILDEVTELLKIEYKCVRSVPGITRRLLNDDEMVNGIPGKINPIDMSTSPGFPFVKQRTLTGVNGKYEWFEETIHESGRKLYSPRPILADRLNLRESAAQNGQRIESIAYSCLKDETRPLARVEQGITRVFICLPMDYNLLIRKYFGMYTATQHAMAGRIPSSVGIDPVTGWKTLYNRLRSKGTFWEDFDYKNWDQFLHPEFVKRYASIVNAWYGDSDDSPTGKVRHVLMQELVYTYLIVGNRLFMKTGGQCSGCAITAEINCDIHDIIMFYIFYILAQENDITLADNGHDSILTFYRENVELALYGDDIVKSATKHITSWFNGKTISPLMDKLGMKITPADKESVDFVIKKPEEVTFLKRSFKPDPKYPERFVRAPLDWKTIWNIPQWIKQCDDKQGATRVNCEMALREMYMYGESNFNNARDLLNKRIEAYNVFHPGATIRPLTLTYSKLEEDYEEGTLAICYPKGWFDMPEDPFLV
uniref:Uncharacterized protein n=1 Tax=Teucrium fruticans picorna-like virus TaxID=2739856 RepID=A0A6M9BKJ5_9VIRU|nr:hypothetical protein 2 [Teucrium fruticans picorna-like virus]